MGKNRLLDGIELLPYVSVTAPPTQSAHLPTPVDRPAGVDPGRPRFDAALVKRRVRVGIIDVALAPHQRLEGSYLAEPGGLDLRDPGEVREGWRGHATFIANIILSEVPSAELVVRTALVEVDPKAVGSKDRWRMPLWHLAECLVEFADAGVDVLNCSLGCETFDGQPPLVLQRAIAWLSPSVAVVAAAGNHGALPPVTAAAYAAVPPSGNPSAALFPAALDGVLAVGAIDEHGQVADFNPRGGADGEWAPWIDGFCRGTDVVSAYLGDGVEGGEEVDLSLENQRPRTNVETFHGWARWTGTSFAAAHASARIAALIATEGTSPQEALKRLREDPGFSGPGS
jgi:hypothetical protein